MVDTCYPSHHRSFLLVYRLGQWHCHLFYSVLWFHPRLSMIHPASLTQWHRANGCSKAYGSYQQVVHPMPGVSVLPRSEIHPQRWPRHNSPLLRFTPKWLHHNPMLPCISGGRTTNQATNSSVPWTLVSTSRLRRIWVAAVLVPVSVKGLVTTAQHMKTLFAEGLLYVEILASTSSVSVNFKAHGRSAWFFF